MEFPKLNPVEMPAVPGVPWTAWLIGAGLLVMFMGIAILLLRKQLRRKPPVTPPIDPALRAVTALGSIPEEWSTEKCAAAGARILRGFLATRGFGPGLAYPAKEFSGLRAAEGWRQLTSLLEEMESMACRPHPVRADWQEARELALRALLPPPLPKGGQG